MSSRILLGILLLCPLAAWTADPGQPIDIKPGLWEISGSSQFVQPALREMSADNRRVPAPTPSATNVTSPPQGRSFNICVTKDGFAQAFAEGYSGIPASLRQRAACNQKVLSSSTSKVRIHMECSAGNAAKVVSDIVVKRLDADDIKGTGLMTAVAGVPFPNDVTMTGKFVSADCGDVKPPANH